MYFVGLGLALIAMKYLGFGPVAQLSWVWVLSPFAMAVVWWAWSDASGYTRKRAMQRESERKNARRDRNLANTGTLVKGRKS